MDFKTALYNQLNDLKVWSPGQNLLWTILSNPYPSAHQTATITHMELMTRVKLGIPLNASVNWSQGSGFRDAKGAVVATIDWASILADIEQWLPTILSLIGTIIGLFTPAPTPSPATVTP